jgi:uncharacterized protein
VLILLPPSEGKTAPAAGSRVDLRDLSHGSLTAARQRVGNALIATSARRNALELLHAGASLAGEVANNTTLWDNPAAPAAQVYSGVLFDAAGASEWSADTLARAASTVRIMSALWGVVSPADVIPAYRLSAGTTLGRLGNVTSFWRTRLAAELDPHADNRLVIDCRSSGYASMWGAPKDQTLGVRVERELDGKRAVVSHFAKHWRGLLTAHLLAQPRDAATPEDVATTASGIPGVAGVELKPRTLTLVVTG